jgi:predicted dehydrogenase
MATETRHLGRRHFVQLSAGYAALSALPRRATADVAGANEQVTVGVLGLNGRGTDLIGSLDPKLNVNIAYLCDVDKNVIGKAIKKTEARQKSVPKVVTDFREVLTDKSVDAVIIATPDHWHAPATLHALAAGKHVYVEKPMSHNLVEGRKVCDAVEKTGLVVQTGTQRRSSQPMAELIQRLHEGAIGKIHFTRTWITSRRENIGFAKDGPVPAGVNYDLWLGPAPERPFNPNHFHYRWHWFWEYGTGELGNNGVHGLDVARWGLGAETPTAVSSIGGKFFFQDDQVTPDTQLVVFEYPDKNLVWEHRTWSPYGIDGSTFGVVFQGETGTAIFDGRHWWIEGEKPVEKVAVEGSGALTTVHFADWLKCIRSGGSPTAAANIGHASASLCHIGNISQRLGRKLPWNGERETFGDSEADTMLGRTYRSQWELPTV